MTGTGTEAPTYRSRYDWPGPLPSEVSPADLAKIESRLRGTEFMIGEREYENPNHGLIDGQPRLITGGGRLVEFGDAPEAVQHRRIGAEVAQLAAERRRQREQAERSAAQDRERRTCACCAEVAREVGEVELDDGRVFGRVCPACRALVLRMRGDELRLDAHRLEKVRELLAPGTP